MKWLHILGLFLVSLVSLGAGCAKSSSKKSAGKFVPSSPSSKIIPPVPVIGSYLSSELLDMNGVPLGNTKVLVFESPSDEVNNATSSVGQSPPDLTNAQVVFETTTDAHGKFSVPIERMQSKRLLLKLKKSLNVVFSEVILPPDLAISVSRARVDAKLPPLIDMDFSSSERFNPLSERKMVLQISRESAVILDSEPTGAPVEVSASIRAISLPDYTVSQTKAFSFWPAVEDLSTDFSARFTWNDDFSQPAQVYIVFSPDLLSLSQWDGRMENAPVWPGGSVGANVVSDFIQCSDPTFRGANSGPLMSVQGSSCGILRADFPFNSNADVFVRIVGESSSEIKLSAVYLVPRVTHSNAKAFWKQEAYVKAVNNDVDDHFGSSLALSGETLAVGVSGEDSGQLTITNGTTASADNSSTMSGAVYVYKKSAGSWAQEAYVKAVNNSTLDQFGRALALSGDTLVVGAFGEDSNQTTITNGPSAVSNNAGTDSGAAYVYKRTGVTWAQEAYLKAPNNDNFDNFGQSVTFSGDTLAVGAMNEDSSQNTITTGPTASADNTSLASGAVYVYVRTGAGWAQQAYVKAVNNNPDDYFGWSVALSGDSLAVGALYESSLQTTITNGPTITSENSETWSSAVYVYRREAALWSQEAFIKVSLGGQVGNALAFSGDVLAAGSGSGVYIFNRSGRVWAQESFLKSSNMQGTDNFGVSVSLVGGTLAVGASFEDSNQTTVTNGPTASGDNSASESGAAYVLKRTGSAWTQEAYLKAVNSGADDFFGHSVAVSGDTLAVGAFGEDSSQTTVTNGGTASTDNARTDSGAVYIYSNSDTLFDPDIRMVARTQTSITFAWNSNLGSASAVRVAPHANGTESAPASCTGGNVLNGGETTYVFEGLSAGTLYGFRFCAWDGSNASQGTTFWEETLP